MPRTRAENSQTAGGSGTAGFKADHAAGWEGAKRERSVFRTRHRRERSGRAGRGYCCLCGNIRCRPGVGAGLHVDISGYIDIVKQDWRMHCRHTPRTVVCGQVREEQPSAMEFQMKILDLIRQRSTPFYSLEFFPPKDREEWPAFFERVVRLKAHEPAFCIRNLRSWEGPSSPTRWKSPPA